MPVTNNQSGFTLIEAMITLVVFSVGLLGMAALQQGALRSSTSASWQSHAAWYAYDIADRMRSNRAAALNDDYSGADTDNPPSDPGCVQSGCSPNQLADTDIVSWAEQVAALPEGRGVITAGPVTGQFTVSVIWGESGEGCDPDNADAYDGQACYRLMVDI